MKYDPTIHHRRSIRLRGYDYAQAGAYFITICAQDRECLFGNVVNGAMQLNEYGEMVQFTWNDLVNHVADIELDAFVVMPNHIHGIVVIVGANVGAGSVGAGSVGAGSVGAGSVGAGSVGVGSVGAGSVGAGSEPAPTAPNTRKPQPLSEIVRQFKTFSARRINAKRGTRGIPVWQRNYWERIIRNEQSYNQIAAYILNNPQKWQQDKLYLAESK